MFSQKVQTRKAGNMPSVTFQMHAEILKRQKIIHKLDILWTKLRELVSATKNNLLEEFRAETTNGSSLVKTNAAGILLHNASANNG